MISKEEVQRIAKLARLQLTEKEIERMQKDLSEILDYFNLLKKAPSGGIISAKSGIRNELRADEAAKGEGEPEKLVVLAPDKKDGYIKVKAVL